MEGVVVYPVTGRSQLLEEKYDKKKVMNCLIQWSLPLTRSYVILLRTGSASGSQNVLLFKKYRSTGVD